MAALHSIKGQFTPAINIAYCVALHFTTWTRWEGLSGNLGTPTGSALKNLKRAKLAQDGLSYERYC